MFIARGASLSAGAMEAPGNLVAPAGSSLPECGRIPQGGGLHPGWAGPKCGILPHSGKRRERLLACLPGSWFAPALGSPRRSVGPFDRTSEKQTDEQDQALQALALCDA